MESGRDEFRVKVRKVEGRERWVEVGLKRWYWKWEDQTRSGD